jgi:small subunit ribosomal protein S6
MLMNEYETTVVLRADLSGDAIEATLDKVRSVMESTGAKLLAINHWGKKKLAYEMQKQTRGIYVHTHYLGGGEAVSELERNLCIFDQVLRFLTIRMVGDFNFVEYVEKDYVKPEYEKYATMDVEEQPEERFAARRSFDDESGDDVGGDYMGDDVGDDEDIKE